MIRHLYPVFGHGNVANICLTPGENVSISRYNLFGHSKLLLSHVVLGNIKVYCLGRVGSCRKFWYVL